jgi:hypothetical protein
MKGRAENVCCTVHHVELNLMLDLGAKMSLIISHETYEAYDRYFRDVQLREATLHLESYDGSDIAVLGRMSTSVQYDIVRLPEFEFYVSAHGAFNMGVNLFDALGFQVRDPRNMLVSVVGQTTAKEFTRCIWLLCKVCT